MAFHIPSRIRIPTIGVDAPIAAVDLSADGDLPAPSPTDRNLAGWYAQSTAPGSIGNAVIDGHVDTMQGPAVFYLLGELHRGDPVDITRTDGSVAGFTVDAVQLYPRSAVPTDQVFGPADTPRLRLLTCGGGYTKATGYQGTVVVYAHLSKTSHPEPAPRTPGQATGSGAQAP
jgi:sortase (surface protein transpeptidase)